MLNDQMEQELLKRSILGKDATTVTGMLKGDGSKISPAVPHVDYIPSVSSANIVISDQSRTITVSPDYPSGGNDGDIWIRYT